MKKMLKWLVIALFAVAAISCAQNVPDTETPKGDVQNEETATKGTVKLTADLAQFGNDSLAGAGYFIRDIYDLNSSWEGTIPAEYTEIAFDLGELDIDKELELEVEILVTGKFSYKGTVTHKVKVGENKVAVTFTKELYEPPLRYVLWDNMPIREGNPNKLNIKGYKIFSDVNSNTKFADGVSGSDNIFIDSATADNGDIYVLEMYLKEVPSGNSELSEPEFYYNIIKYNIDGTVSNIKTELKTEKPGKGAIDVIYDQEKNDYLVVYISYESNGGKEYNLHYFYSKAPESVVHLQVGKKVDTLISSIKLDNDFNLYYAFTESKESESGYYNIIYKIENLKATTENSSLLTGLETAKIDIGDIRYDVTDLAVFENKLYAIAILETTGMSGGVLYSLDLASSNPVVRTEYQYQGNFMRNEADTKKYFVGPRKFVAVKPKKLIIIDDGCWAYISEESQKLNNLNRIITIDLESATTEFSNTINLEDIEFDGYGTKVNGGSDWSTDYNPAYFG